MSNEAAGESLASPPTDSSTLQVPPSAFACLAALEQQHKQLLVKLEAEGPTEWKKLLSFLRREGALSIDEQAKRVEDAIRRCFDSLDTIPVEEQRALRLDVKLHYALVALYYEGGGDINGTLAATLAPFRESASRCLAKFTKDCGPLNVPDLVSSEEREQIVGLVRKRRRFPIWNLEPRQFFGTPSMARRQREQSSRYAMVETSVMGAEVPIISTAVTRNSLRTPLPVS